MSGDEKIVMPAPEEIDRAVEHIVEEGLGKGTAAGQKRRRTLLWALGGAAVIALVLTVGIPLFRKGTVKGHYPGVETVQAVRPESTAKNMSAEEYARSEAAIRWAYDHKSKAAISLPLWKEMRPYYEQLMAQMLADMKDNAVCSPLSIYLTLSMLAGVTAGNTQKQILNLLNVPDTEILQENVAALWEGNYSDVPALQSLLANSFWLNGRFDYNRATLQRLAKKYFADSFIGEPGSDAMDRALQKWTNDNTGGLLSEYIKDMKLYSDDVLALVSTVYFKESWEIPFTAEKNTRETFHGTNGDTEVVMMHKENSMEVYEGEHFTSVAIPLQDSGFVYICLPEEGTDAAGVAADPELLNIVHMNDHRIIGYNTTVRLSLPKFTVSGETDLKETLQLLGITDVMDRSLADFTPLAANIEKTAGLYLDKAVHAAKVSIDEEGVIGAAYTMLGIPEIGEPETIELTVDRPFFFLVTGQDNSILFAGVVQNIE